MTTTHTDLIKAAQAIGAIAESADWYTRRLAEATERHGGPLAMSVGELIELDRQVREQVQPTYAEALA